MARQQEYAQLQQTDGEQQAIQSRSTTFLDKRHVFLSCTSVILTVALLASIAFNITLMASESRPELSCGTSISEAQSRGCTFDYLAKAWLPPQCPRVGTEEFLELGGGSSSQAWKYWQDRDGQVEWPDISDLADITDAKWWTTEKEHLTHCAYLLIRMSHALHSGSRVDRLTGNLGHTKHCTLYLLNRSIEAPTRDSIITIGNSFFGSC